MKIVTKMTAALVAVGVLAFSVYAWVALATEERELRAAVERESSLLARSLQVAIENALRDDQQRDIAETLQRLDRVAPDVDVAVHDLEGRFRARSDGSRATASREGRLALLAISTREKVVIFEPDDAHERLVLALPILTDEGELLGAVTLAKPLDGLAADLETTRHTILVSLAAFLFASLLVGYGLGGFFIGRPMGRLLHSIDAVRRGENQVDLPTRRPDEVGEAARAFEQMLDTLDAERRAKEAETRRRQEAERELAHADKLIAVGRLSARIAHEVGSPLQVLVGRAEAIVQHPETTSKISRHAQIIAEQGTRVTTILRDLLAWVRPSASEPRRVDPRAEVEAVADLLELELRHRQVALVIESDPTLPPIQARAGQMQQVLFNLVRNALNASPDGARITVTLRALDHALELTVADTGEGMEPELQARLFEPFFTTRLDSGGVGLGLTVVRGLVEEHGGRVSVESAPGRGTRITIVWPSSEAA